MNFFQGSLGGSATTYKGGYNSALSYKKNDTVSMTGTVYICIKNAPAGITPANDVYWKVYQAAGAASTAIDDSNTNTASSTLSALKIKEIIDLKINDTNSSSTTSTYSASKLENRFASIYNPSNKDTLNLLTDDGENLLFNGVPISGDSENSPGITFEDIAVGETFTIITESAPVSPLVITSSINGGTFNSAQNVSLTSNKSNTTIYYTTNGSTPTESSSLYNGAINISNTSNLKFFGKDSLGNKSSIQTISFIINISAPDTTPPLPASNLVAGTVTDTTIPISWTLSSSNDVANYEVSYSTDGTNYTVANSSIGSTTNTYILTGRSANTQYTIRLIAIDTSGNRSTAVTVQATTASAPEVENPIIDASRTYYMENPANGTTIANPSNYFMGTGEFTLAVTVKVALNGANAANKLVSRFINGGTENVMQLEFTWNNLFTSTLVGTKADGTTAWAITSTSSPTTYTDYTPYYHVVMMREGTAFKLFVNNVQIASSTISTTDIVRQTSSLPLTIGQANGTATFKNVSYYNRALTLAERTQNFNALK